jgi:hypothetical protein
MKSMIEHTTQPTRSLLLLMSILASSGALAQAADNCMQAVSAHEIKNTCPFNINVMWAFLDNRSSGCTMNAPCGGPIAPGQVLQDPRSISGAKVGACKDPSVPFADPDGRHFTCK